MDGGAVKCNFKPTCSTGALGGFAAAGAGGADGRGGQGGRHAGRRPAPRAVPPAQAGGGAGRPPPHCPLGEERRVGVGGPPPKPTLLSGSCTVGGNGED